MAKLYVAQIAHLSQDLIEHVTNANNLMARAKHMANALKTVNRY